MDVPAKLAALRKRLRALKLDAYFVPNADPHQSEYAPACFERRAWLSGFSGSAGDVLVARKQAWLWTDGRYFLQAEQQLQGSGIELMRQGLPGVPTIDELLASALNKGARVGVDPRVISPMLADRLRNALLSRGAELVLLEDNLVDAIWLDRPPLPASPMMALARRYTGETVATKLKRVRAHLDSAAADALVLTMLDAIAWTFNIRARDVAFNPVAIAYAVVTRDSAYLFTETGRVSPAVLRHLGKHVSLAPYDAFAEELKRLGKRKARVWVDGATASRWVVDCLDGARVQLATSPISRMKARKNETELSGIRAAHVRDGVAMVRFLAWLERVGPSGEVTEMEVAAHLESLRAEGEHFQGLSFPTIAGFGPNGAIIHYHPTAATNRRIKSGGMLLLDSGAQYLDGTTDITRTLAIGQRPSAAQKRNFTRVLSGHIALATARFPEGATGARLDTLARQFLWQDQRDYAHGTGHGVGAFLNVHEGPQSISHRPQTVPLEPGNIQSNEPGYYEPGRYGIRIENLVEAVPVGGAGAKPTGFLQFDTLSVCPIDTSLVDLRFVHDAHRKWLNRYHARVRRTLSPWLDTAHKRWLTKACRSI